MVSSRIRLAFRPGMGYRILTMKSFLTVLTLAAFVCVNAAQAGENCDKAKAGCCADKAKASCCEKDAKQAKKADVSVKGATLLVRK